jgi:SAM-dependent methyltransferase
VDSSSALIEHAREVLPGVHFVVQDARELQLATQFDAILSTFDSLNHILTLDGLREAFVRARRALRTGGLFVFDMNLQEAYVADLQDWAVTVDDSNVTLVRGSFDPASQKGATELIWFVREESAENTWRQRRSIVEERCYPESDIMLAVREAGFEQIEAVSATDVGMRSTLAFGRFFFSVR